MRAARYKNSFREKVKDFIAQTEGNVILRSELKELGSPRQISRALRALVEESELIRFGYGVYAKARPGIYIEKPILKGNFDIVCIEALDKLGITWELGSAIREYNEGKTTQVPVYFIIRLKCRFRSVLSDGSRTLVYEDNVNAK